MNFLNKFLKLKLIFIISLVICCYSLKSFSLSNDEFYKINKFIEQENVELAFQYLKKNNFLEFSESSNFLILIGKIYIVLEQPIKAANYFEKVLFSSTKNQDYALTGLAKINFDLGNISEAEKYISKSIKINPNLVDNKILYAQLLAEKNLYDEAIKAFDVITKSETDSTYVQRNFIKMLIRINKFKQAEDILSEIKNENKIDALTLELFSDINLIKGRIKDAINYRLEAKKEYLLTGNKIKANKVDEWLKFNTIKDDNYFLDEIDSISKSNLDVSNQNISQNNVLTYEKKQNKTAFRPKDKPQKIFIDNTKPVFTGSGIIINNGYKILTNKHVVENLNYIIVRNGLGEIREVVDVQVSTNHDLAILILSDPYPHEYSINDEDYYRSEPGSNIFVLGYPISSLIGSFHPSITEGIISNPVGFEGKIEEFQITAKINPGNSGGPIINKFGKIVGIVAGKIDKDKIIKKQGFIPEDINIAINSSTILSFLDLPQKKINNILNQTHKIEYDAQDLYKFMRSSVVFIAAQR